MELKITAEPDVKCSLDFITDRQKHARGFRQLNSRAEFNRDGLDIEAEFSIAAKQVTRTLFRIIGWLGQPLATQQDNGSSYISGTRLSWAGKRGIADPHIQPCKPQQNAYIERQNQTVRREWLGQYTRTIEEVMDTASEWRWTYNQKRLNMSPAGITSAQKPWCQMEVQPSG